MRGEWPTNCAISQWRGCRAAEQLGVVTAKPLIHSILEWLRAGYPEVPGEDRVPLLALLRSTPLTEDQVKEVVRHITDKESTEPPGHKIDHDEID